MNLFSARIVAALFFTAPVFAETRIPTGTNGRTILIVLCKSAPYFACGKAVEFRFPL